MQHYFSSDPMTEHDERTFTVKIDGATAEFTTDAGVFSRDEVDPGSRLLVESVGTLSGRVLDMGCGWGAMTIMTLARFPSVNVTMADVNERALALAVSNVEKNKMQVKKSLQKPLQI